MNYKEMVLQIAPTAQAFIVNNKYSIFCDDGKPYYCLGYGFKCEEIAWQEAYEWLYEIIQQKLSN